MAGILERFKRAYNDALDARAPAGGGKRAVYSVGGYEAAAITRDRSWIWTTTQEEATNPTTFTRTEIARISRYLVNNFALMERILTVSESYGVGAGLIASAATGDASFNAAATAAFDAWASSVFCSANNHYTFYEMQKILVRELIVAGEVFIVLTKAATGYPQLMLVASENVKHSGQPGDASVDGLWLDEFGKVTAYNVFSGGACQKVDASDVVHIMRHKSIGQLRGIGAFAASLNSMRDLKDCMVLEKKAIKVHSSLAAVVERKAAEAGNGTYGNVLKADAYGNPLPDPQAQQSNAGLERAFAGAVAYVEPGEKVNLVASERSSDGFFKFVEALSREVCLNISLPFEFVVNADRLTGTGIRFVLSDAAFYFQNLQTTLLDGGLQRIYSWVVASLLVNGKLAPPEGDLLWASSWTRPMSVVIDPQRVSNAEIQQLQNSMTTYEQFYSSRGRDYRQELRQHALEEAYLDELSRETGVPVSRLRVMPAGTVLLPEDREEEISGSAKVT